MLGQGIAGMGVTWQLESAGCFAIAERLTGAPRKAKRESPRAMAARGAFWAALETRERGGVIESWQI